MLTGNKGEWSEIYALLKLLGDKVLFGGDPDLNRIEHLFYPIVKIIRTESGGNYEYELEGDLVIISGGVEVLRKPVSDFQEKAAEMLEDMRGRDGAFSLPEIEAFMNQVNCHSIKAKSSSKSDIRIVIHDTFINQQTELGFSIKSQLGNPSTLLNSGKATNFIYELESFYPPQERVYEINSIESSKKIKDRIVAIKSDGGAFAYRSVESDVFKNNLVLIDSFLPNILGFIIEAYYTTTLNSIKALVAYAVEQNPLGYDTSNAHQFYEYKIKRFLTDVALGMTPAKVWNGVYDATGGYLVVKRDGDVLCYHIYNRNKFEDYLYANTRLDTPSSSRHEFGAIYEDNGRLYFKLNLLVRFI